MDPARCAQMPTIRKARTYRARQLPSYLRYPRQVADLLTGIAEGLGQPENIKVFSLATSLNLLEIPPTKVATFMFEKVPPLFDNDKDQWTIPGQSIGFARDIIVDVHFLDFTPLNDVPPDDHTTDCIAISGLASHPFGSWKESGTESTFMWLRDRVPKEIPNMRSILYGYDTRLVGSNSVKGIEDIAIGLIGKMKSIGRAGPSAKPLIMLAHSLGGIILKQAMTLMAGAKDSSDPLIASILGVIFFGVPNQGMIVSHLLQMVDGQPNEALVHALSPASDFLKSLDEQFSGIITLRNIKIMSVYETKRSPTVKISSTGQYERSGTPALLVDSRSAIQRNSHRTLPVDEDHSNMVKFRADDPDCRVIIDYMDEVANNEQRGPSVQTAQSDYFTKLSKSKGTRLGISDMLDSLNVAETGYRLEEIQERSQSTFEWIYENKDLAFGQWLGKDCGLYWVNGKPGSGKSTLMKFARQDPRTDSFIRDSDPEATHLIIDFFFHERGSSMQKTLEGLLHRLLFQLLAGNKQLAEIIFPSFQDRVTQQQEAWSVFYMRQALDIILEQSEYLLHITVFLDALDEFDGEPETVADFVKDIVRVREDSNTRVKVCCASRPWNTFDDAFDGVPGFKIHEHTEGNILKYIDIRLKSNIRMRQLKSQDKANSNYTIEALELELGSRAEGVFVWVRIVLDELLKVCTDGALPKELMSVLSSFPRGLDASYQRMLDRTDPAYRFESYAMIEIVLRSKDSLCLRDLGLAVLCALGSTPSESAERLPHDPYSHEFLESTRRRIQSRCGGLLEVLPDTTVQFMHQTAKSFFSRPGVSEAILQYDPTLLKENGYSFLTKFWITLAVATSRRFNWWAYLLTMFHGLGIAEGSYILKPHHFAVGAKSVEDYEYFSHSMRIMSPEVCLQLSAFHINTSQNRLLDYAHLAELSTGRSQKAFIDGIPDQAMIEFFRGYPIVRTQAYINSRLSFAVAAHLRLYMRESLEGGNNINAIRGTPLLHCAVAHSWRSMDDRDPIEMSQLLLNFGASTSKVYNGPDMLPRDSQIPPISPSMMLTAFQVLFLGSFQGQGIKDYNMGLAKVFLRNGQDPNIDVFVHKIRQRQTGHAFQPLDRVPTTCKPLHAANNELTLELLNHGALVNSLDSLKQTPLDVMIRYLHTLALPDPLPGEEQEACEALNHIFTLQDHGGCLNSCKMEDVEFILQMFVNVRGTPFGERLLSLKHLNTNR